MKGSQIPGQPVILREMLKQILEIDSEVQSILTSLYFGILAFAIISGAQRWKSLDLSGQILWFVILFAFQVEIFRVYVAGTIQMFTYEYQDCVVPFRKLRTAINVTLLQVMVLIEMVGYGLLAFATLGYKDLFRKTIIWLLIAVLFLQLIHIYLPKLKLQNPGNGALCLSTSCFAIWVLYRLAASTHTSFLTRESAFWVWSALLIYHCCTLAFWGFQDLLTTPYKNPHNWQQAYSNVRISNTQKLLSHGHAILNMLQYLILGCSFFAYQKKRSHV